MKFSMWIFADWLSDYQLDIDIRSGKMEIDSVRLFSNEVLPEKTAMYIGKKSDLFTTEQSDVICVHRNDIIIIDCNDINEILNHILRGIERYTKWTSALSNMTAQGAMLSDLIQISQDVLPYPIVIFDAAQRAIAFAENYGPGDVDEEYDAIITSGSISMERILDFNRLYPDLQSWRGVFYMDKHFWPNSTYSVNFYEDNEWLSTIILIDRYDSCTQGTLDTFSTLSRYIQQWSHLHSQGEKKSQTDTIFRRALSQNEKALDELSRLLTLRDWDSDDAKCLIKLCSLSEVFNIHIHLAKTLRSVLDTTFVTTYDDAVLLLCNLSHKEITRYQTELIPWLKKCSYYGCCSESFTDVHLLPQHYEQACITQQHCQAESGAFYSVQPYLLSYGAHLAQMHSPIPLIHPTLSDLIAYDEAHHSELVKTLHVYLTNNCNQQHAAKALSLHRNSFLYRLQRIEDILKTDFSEALERMHLLYSLEYLL